MSKLKLGVWAALGMTWLAGWGPANAQPPGAPRGPYSPYLNLARPGNPAINYYGLVRPEQEFRSGIAGLRNQVGALNQEVNAMRPGATAPLQTGHPVAFMNYSHYYSGFRGRAGGGAQPAGGPMRR